MSVTCQLHVSYMSVTLVPKILFPFPFLFPYLFPLCDQRSLHGGPSPCVHRGGSWSDHSTDVWRLPFR